MFPYVDQVRFLKTGSEACSAAIRIARAVTGRHMVLSEAYHGWHDAFVSLTPPALGVPHHQEIAPLARMPDVAPDSVAAVIVEPVITDDSPARIKRLHELRAWCDKHGALLIFDEVITGFRTPGNSVAKRHNVTPDLSCFGKAIANGMPLAAVAGSAKVMSGADYFVSSSYAGETLSLAAALKTMTLLQTKYDIQHLWEKGEHFISRFNKLYAEGLQIEGYGTRGVFKGNDMTRALFFQEACKAGILFGPTWFWCLPHAEHTDITISACRHILGKIDRGEVALEGEMPSSPFAQKVREQGR
jgi:glutamate-1-semialdehyde 2,1-aminomutase/spore coat polysaccharide biosynthesis protein SpsF